MHAHTHTQTHTHQHGTHARTHHRQKRPLCFALSVDILALVLTNIHITTLALLHHPSLYHAVKEDASSPFSYPHPLACINTPFHPPSPFHSPPSSIPLPLHSPPRGMAVRRAHHPLPLPPDPSGGGGVPDRQRDHVRLQRRRVRGPTRDDSLRASL